MRDVERVGAVLTRLEQSLGPGRRVVDAALRQQIVDAHAAVGWDPAAEVVIELGPPAAPEDLHDLEQLWRQRFGATLPADYRALLERHDGIQVYDAEPGTEARARSPNLPEQLPGGDVLMSCRAVRDWLETIVYEETDPSGARGTKHPPFSPFFDLDGDSWYGFDFSSGATSRPAIIHPDAETLWGGAESPVASSFTEWLGVWVEGGMEPVCLFAPSLRRPASLPEPGFAASVPTPPQLASASPLPTSSTESQPAPLSLVRPRLAAWSGVVFFGGFLLLLIAWHRMTAEVVPALALFAYFVWRVRSSGHVVEIDERGVYDGALGRPRIAWSEVVDVGIEGSDAAGRLTLRLAGPPAEDVRVALDGVQVPLATVCSSAIAFWHANGQRPR